MKLSEFAKILETPVQEVLGWAKKSNLKISHDTDLTADQITQLKRVKERPIARPQLPESNIEQPSNEQMAISEDSSIESIAAQTHTKLSKSRQAKNAQAHNLFQTAVQSEYANGQDRGLLLGLVNEQGAVDAYMAIQQAFAGVGQADLSIQAADHANFLSQDNNLLGELQNPCKSYSQSEDLLATVRSGAAKTQSDLNQILSSLHEKSSPSATKSE
jgi:hypothetical protein